MGAVAGTGTTFGLPNYVGELFHITPSETPLLTMIGGLQGGEANSTKEDTWQTDDNNAAGQTAALEGADPDYENRDRSDVSNVKQIFQYGFSVTYTKQAATGNVAADMEDVLGSNPVQDEISHQRMLKMRRMARDVEFSLLQGTYAKPSDNTSPRKMRGAKNFITTNTVNAGGSNITKGNLDSLLKQMADSGAPFTNPVLFCNSHNKQVLSNIYAYAPESRNVGGVNINQIETDFTPLAIQYDRHMPTDEIYILDLAYLNTTHLAIPGKGLVFVEPLSQSGSAWNFQLYGEIGFKYGPELWHGAITNTATS